MKFVENKRQSLPCSLILDKLLSVAISPAELSAANRLLEYFLWVRITVKHLFCIYFSWKYSAIFSTINENKCLVIEIYEKYKWNLDFYDLICNFNNPFLQFYSFNKIK